VPGVLTRLATGLDRATDNLALVAVPVVLALLNTDKLLAVTSFDGVHVGFKLGLPVSVVTVWQFVSVPQSGVSVGVGLPVERLPLAVVTVPLFLLVQAGLTAGYFGACRNALAGEPYAFLAGVRRYGRPFLVLTAVPVLLLLPLALGVVGVGSVTGSLGAAALAVVPVLVAALVLAYLFFATPYLVVLCDTDLVAAARRSYALATGGGPYLAYAAGFAAFVLVVSPAASALVVSVPVVGLPVGVVGGGLLGLAANLATMQFVADVDSGVSLGADGAGDGG
jgi:hypothetical protein